MNHSVPSEDDALVEVRNAQAASSVVVVCEHASAHIPTEFAQLGLATGDLQSHVVWDPGAMALATRLAARLDACLVASKTSRLVYDCNRPPEAPDAIPARSEVVDVPGNTGLTAAQEAARVQRYYHPFRAAVARAMAGRDAPVLVTIHSFTPVYHGKPRTVDIGVVHDADRRLADALLSDLAGLVPMIVRRNEPYGPRDGVTHTLKEHALPGGHLNVMLEVRNDLVASAAQQTTMAETLATWLTRALSIVETSTCKV